jgi:hypothetical protein
VDVDAGQRGEGLQHAGDFGRIGMNEDAADIHEIAPADEGAAIEMALTGHGARHAPQPVQASRSIATVAPPPSLGRKRIAPVSQTSAHMRQDTPFRSTQASDTDAVRLHARARGGFSKQLSGQASAQAPQNVHAPRAKSTIG